MILDRYTMIVGGLWWMGGLIYVAWMVMTIVRLRRTPAGQKIAEERLRTVDDRIAELAQSIAGVLRDRKEDLTAAEMGAARKEFIDNLEAHIRAKEDALAIAQLKYERVTTPIPGPSTWSYGVAPDGLSKLMPVAVERESTPGPRKIDARSQENRERLCASCAQRPPVDGAWYACGYCGVIVCGPCFEKIHESHAKQPPALDALKR